MYAYIIGQVTAMEAEKIILENNGIGYELATSLKAMSRFQVGEEVKVYTRYIVRDDGVFLFGFYDEQERDMFDRLTKVSAVGPKVALSILSSVSVEGIVRAVQTQDLATLTKAPGVGKKTAGRILLELMDQVKDWAIEGAVLPQEETLPTQEEFDVALQGLLNLGYQRSEAMRALKGLDPSLPLSTLMRAALQRLS
ncbi:Holliday junction branch migration protein RuvA [Levyella massiliensis]|uniref:Holliday junction branch migration protein RuvA n=2 Tax=Levyella massiliensis TaxID=938289 RepID=UPI000363833E|nr:Holliday junction branch migration protein RuvA [Levyella massiliensis]